MRFRVGRLNISIWVSRPDETVTVSAVPPPAPRERHLCDCHVTEQDREAFKEAIRRYWKHKIDHCLDYDDHFDEFFHYFMRGDPNGPDGRRYNFVLELDMSDGDRYFMKMLADAIRGAR